MNDDWTKVKEEKSPSGMVQERVEPASENHMEVENPSGMGSFEEGSKEEPDETELVQVKEEMPEVVA